MEFSLFDAPTTPDLNASAVDDATSAVADSKIRQMSRIRQLEALTRSLAERESQFRTVVESVHDAILVLDADDGTLLDMNRRMMDISGFSKDALRGSDMGKFSFGISPYTGKDALRAIHKARQGEPITMPWLARTASGRLLWVEVTFRPARIGDADRIIATVRDISERKRAETEHSARLKRAEAQNGVSLALAAAGPDFGQALDLVARYLAVQLGDLCSMSLLEGDQFVTQAIGQSYLDGDALLPSMETPIAMPLDAPGIAEVLSSKEAYCLHHEDPGHCLGWFPRELHAYCRQFYIHTLLFVPMRFQERVIGIITLAKGGAGRPYSFEDQAMLQGLADRTALTINNGILYQENIAQAEALRVINAELEQRVHDRTAELALANEQLQRMATSDGLTGIPNRRHFNEVMELEMRRTARAVQEMSLILCDVDFFKRYNDHYGHVAGDTCLQAVGEAMRSVFRRASELPARYGGEEFAAILPGASAQQAMHLANKLREAIVEKAIPHDTSDAAPYVTLSIGVATIIPQPHQRPNDLIAMADEALYQSKQTGRNRVTAHDSSHSCV